MRTFIFCAMGAATLIVACGAGEQTSPFRQLDSTRAEAQAPVSFRSPVKEHAMRGAIIRDAIARGDLDASHVAAASLVEYVTANEHPDPRSKVGEMVEAARRVEAARALPEAAQSFAILAEKCGACHAAFRGPRSVPGVAPIDTAALGPRMRRHEWGAARLWEGLVAPSNEAWSSGARVLSDAPLGSEVSVGNDVAPDVARLAATVHDLGLKAATSKDTGDRVQIYGQLLSTCATCHERSGGGPEGTRR